MRLDIADLSLFRHVVDAGSITHGAERAHLALAAASTRIRNMEEAVGAALLVRGRQGVTPTQAGRTLAAACPRDPAPVRAPARGPRRLCRRAGRAGQGAVEHQRADRIPAGGSELVPLDPSACQRRPGGAAERRDRRADRRRGRRHRHRGRHRRCRPADDLSVPPRPLRAGGGARPSARRVARRSTSREVLDHDFVGLDRASALQRFLADKAARIGRPLRLRVQLRSFDAVCRLVERNVGVGIVPETTVRRAAKTMAIKAVASHRPLGGARADDLHPRHRRSCRPMPASSSSICARRTRRPREPGALRSEASARNSFGNNGVSLPIVN